jgi:hypothetical protein
MFKLTIDESVKDVLSIFLNQVVYVPKDATILQMLVSTCLIYPRAAIPHDCSKVEG